MYSDSKLISTFHADKEGYLLYEVLMHSFEIPTSSMMIKRAVIEEINGFDESFRRHQDWEFLVRIAAKYKIQCCDCLGYKRHLVFRNSPSNPDLYKKYRMYWLDKMEPHIEMLDSKQRKKVFLSNRMDVLFNYLKHRNIKTAFKEWREIQPGMYGVKFIFRRITNCITK